MSVLVCSNLLGVGVGFRMRTGEACHSWHVLRDAYLHRGVKIQMHALHKSPQRAPVITCCASSSSKLPHDTVLEVLSEAAKSDGRVAETTNIVLGGSVTETSDEEWKVLNEKSDSKLEGSTYEDNNIISSPDRALFTPPPEWKDWQERKKEEEMLSSQGITIRRRPPTGPPQHYVGPFEFRIQNEGNTPRNKLEEIIWNKDAEVTQMKEKLPLKSILQALPNAPPPRNFIAALRRRAAETNVPALIAEVKKASPSRGVIQPNFDPVRIAQAYEEGGAACISVLTDHKYFQGDFEYLKRVRNAGVQCPLLCKEFIIDAWQLYFARLHGADAVLLIAAILPDQDLRYMSKICKKLGIAALVEVHNAREFDRVLGIDGMDLIGINNRDLETFQVDINNTVELLKGESGHTVFERNILVVGESGLFTPQDIALLQNAGVTAVLVGESLVKQDNPAAGIADLLGKDISLSRQAELQVAV